MAFNAARFTKLDNLLPASTLVPSASLFHYVTADSLATVSAAGYFNSIREQLQVGDQILVAGPDGVRLLTFAAVPASGNIASVQVATAMKSARGVHTSVAAADTVVTGLTTVAGVIASLDDDPVDGVMHVSATIGDQAGAPAAGSVIIKGWKSTDGDATLIAATTFGKKITWFAWGT